MLHAIGRFIGCLIFDIYLGLMTVVVAGTGSLLCFWASKDFHDDVIRFWCHLVFFGLRHFCGITYRVEGMENLPTDTTCIIASKHQSGSDTMIFPMIMKRPAFIIKQELTRIPFYGWELNNGSVVAVQRNGGAADLKRVLRGSKEFLQTGHHLVIYPQGTRVKPTDTVEKYPYKAGVISTFESTKRPIVPVALNAGLFWGKGQFLKNPGVITVKFLPMIPYQPGMDKEQLLKQIQDAIETESQRLVELASDAKNKKE